MSVPEDFEPYHFTEEQQKLIESTVYCYFCIVVGIIIAYSSCLIAE